MASWAAVKGLVFAAAFVAGCSQSPFQSQPDPLQTGHILFERGQYEDALRAYDLAASQQGLTPSILAAMGSANLGLGRLGQAEKLLRLSTEQGEVGPNVWNNLGVVLVERRKYAEAVSAFRHAFATDSGNTDAIRDNLTKALAMRDNAQYIDPQDNGQRLVLLGTGNVRLQTGI